MFALACALVGTAVTQAAVISFHVNLDQNEPIPTGSPGTGTVTGTASIVFDTTAHTMLFVGLMRHLRLYLGINDFRRPPV